jgi:putative acetyltransferase
MGETSLRRPDETRQDFRVRPATPRDASSIQHCLTTAFQPFQRLYTPEAFADTVPTVSGVQERLATMWLFVAETENRVIGTVGCNKVNAREGHLRGMAVLPEWQASGVAAALLAAAEVALRQQGCARVTLDTTEPLQRAMRFYEKHGFRRSGRVGDFFGMPLHEYAKQLGSE